MKLVSKKPFFLPAVTPASLPFLPPSLPPSSPGEKYGREVRVIAVDFSEGQEIYPQLEEQLRDLDIGVLGRKTLWI